MRNEKPVIDTLTMYAMLGRTMQESADLDVALGAVDTSDPSAWKTSIPVALWTGDIGQKLIEIIPQVIQQTGQRPAVVVSDLLMYTLRYGIEIGRNWPERGQTHA